MAIKISWHGLLGVILIMTFISNAIAQSSIEVESGNVKWADLRVGIVADLEGKLFEFSSVTSGLGINFNTNPLLYSIRVNFNYQIPILADAGANFIWDSGI